MSLSTGLQQLRAKEQSSLVRNEAALQNMSTLHIHIKVQTFCTVLRWSAEHLAIFQLGRETCRKLPSTYQYPQIPTVKHLRSAETACVKPFLTCHRCQRPQRVKAPLGLSASNDQSTAYPEYPHVIIKRSIQKRQSPYQRNSFVRFPSGLPTGPFDF